MSDSTSKDLKEALLQLNKLRKEHPALTKPADFFIDVLPGLFEGQSNDRPPAMDQDQAQAKLTDGVPLLRGESVEIDVAAFRRRWLHVAGAIERHQDPAAGKALANIAHENSWDPNDIVTAVLAGAPVVLHTWAEERGLDSSLTATVARLSLYPSLANLHVKLLPLSSSF